MKIRLPLISNFSGADIYFKQLARGLTARGMEAELRSYPHLMEFLPYRAVKPFLSSNGDCDLVHTKAEYGWVFAVRGRPLVVTLAHSVLDPVYEPYKSPLQRLYHNLKVGRNIAHSFELADQIVTVSRFSAQRIAEQFGRQDVRVVYNGVDEKFFRPAANPPSPTDQRTRLLFVGNCTIRKGFDLLMPILDRLGDRFLLEYTSGLRTRGEKSPHPSMRALGRLSAGELLRAYQCCDIFLFPSRLEGFGYPAAEAMACGKPVVCTNYSSLPELIDDDQGGYLCPADDVDAFASRIRRLGQDPELRARMGAYNRAKVEKQFSLSGCIQQYAQLYAELL